MTRERAVRVAAGPVSLEGDLSLPESARGLVLFAHGSGSSRFSPRNRTDWLTEHPDTRALRIGYFGASTGAGAAMVAAAERPGVVGAVVSRGGRPDLAGRALPQVRAPTLLIVGGNDPQVIELNQAALELMRCEKQLVIVPGASHLFEEPGALDEVARLAREWFLFYLAAVKPATQGFTH